MKPYILRFKGVRVATSALTTDCRANRQLPLIHRNVMGLFTLVEENTEAIVNNPAKERTMEALDELIPKPLKSHRIKKSAEPPPKPLPPAWSWMKDEKTSEIIAIQENTGYVANEENGGDPRQTGNEAHQKHAEPTIRAFAAHDSGQKVSKKELVATIRTDLETTHAQLKIYGETWVEYKSRSSISVLREVVEAIAVWYGGTMKILRCVIHRAEAGNLLTDAEEVRSQLNAAFDKMQVIRPQISQAANRVRDMQRKWDELSPAERAEDKSVADAYGELMGAMMEDWIAMLRNHLESLPD